MNEDSGKRTKQNLCAESINQRDAQFLGTGASCCVYGGSGAVADVCRRIREAGEGQRATPAQPWALPGGWRKPRGACHLCLVAAGGKPLPPNKGRRSSLGVGARAVSQSGDVKGGVRINA